MLSLLGLIGFLLALDARRRVKRLENALRALEAEIRALRGPSQAAEAAPAAPPAESAVLTSFFPPPETEPSGQQQPEPMPAPIYEAAPRAPTAAPGAPKPAPVSIEQAIGARWAVYVGGVALALGALLLVRYAFEQGLFGPAARVLMGLALSAVLDWRGRIFAPSRKKRGRADPDPRRAHGRRRHRRLRRHLRIPCALRLHRPDPRLRRLGRLWPRRHVRRRLARPGHRRAGPCGRADRAAARSIDGAEPLAAIGLCRRRRRRRLRARPAAAMGVARGGCRDRRVVLGPGFRLRREALFSRSRRNSFRPAIGAGLRRFRPRPRRPGRQSTKPVDPCSCGAAGRGFGRVFRAGDLRQSRRL